MGREGLGEGCIDFIFIMPSQLPGYGSLMGVDGSLDTKKEKN
jgi:hypothetical protein